MQNSIRGADYLPFLGHIFPLMLGRLENTSFEVVASNRTSVYERIASFAHAYYGKMWKLQRLPNDVICVRSPLSFYGNQMILFLQQRYFESNGTC